MIYDSYRSGISFGMDREDLLNTLIDYFDDKLASAIVFDDGEVAIDSKVKASSFLRYIKSCGWIEYEDTTDHRTIVILQDYAATIIETFNKIVKNQDMEYQSYISQIHSMLTNEASYAKPYEFIIKRVVENTEELISGLKKLNSSIKRRVDVVTKKMTAAEVIKEFSNYHKEIGSQAYHRMKTSDNVSYFRTDIIEKLRYILYTREVFERTLAGYMEIERVEDAGMAEEDLKDAIISIIDAFEDYDYFIREIDLRNARYNSSAVARAKFLLTNTSDTVGKITKILGYISDQINQNKDVSLSDTEDEFDEMFQIYSQGYLDSESLYTQPISKKTAPPQVLNLTEGMSDEEKAIYMQSFVDSFAEIHTIRRINNYVKDLLEHKQSVQASSLPLNDKDDFIRLIYVFIYGASESNKKYTAKTTKRITVNGFTFDDFVIERGEGFGTV
jgi:hypothetical protein